MDLIEGYEPQENFEVCNFFSKDVYEKFIVSEYTTQKADKWKIVTTLIDADYKPYTKGNFACSAYRKNNSIIISFRGTNDFEDMCADVTFLFEGTPPISTKYARKYYDAVKNDNPGCEFIFTGHSLGGAYAQILCAELIKEGTHNIKNVITFNAPGIGYLLQEKEQELEQVFKKLISNYVIMNDYVGNFREHLGDTYYFQPYPLNTYEQLPDNSKKRVTAHGCILSYYKQDYGYKKFGIRYSHEEIKGFNRKTAWALWLYDINNTNPDETLIKHAIQNKIFGISKEDLIEAICIINNSNIEMNNHFNYLAEGIPFQDPYNKHVNISQVEKRLKI